MDRNPTIMAKEHDLLTPLNSIYSFSKTSSTLIDGSENASVGGDLNFRFHILLKGAVKNKLTIQAQLRSKNAMGEILRR